MAVLLRISLKWTPLQEIYNPNLITIVIISIICKIGIFPMHIWVVKMRKVISWVNNLILITWQKIIPIIILIKATIIKTTTILRVISITAMTTIIINSSNIKRLFIASSMGHISWIIMSIRKIKVIPLIYLRLYSTLTFLIVAQLKKWKASFLRKQETKMTNDQTSIKINIISISGIPPFTGFFLKALIIYTLIKYNSPIKITIILLVTATGTFYAYNQTIIKSISLKPLKIKEKKKTNAIKEKSTISWNLLLPFFTIT